MLLRRCKLRSQPPKAQLTNLGWMAVSERLISQSFVAELLSLTRSVFNRSTEVRNRAKVEVAVQSSPSLTALMVSGRKPTTELESTFKESTLKLTASMKLSASFEPKVFSTSKFTVEELVFTRSAGPQCVG